MSGQMRQGGWTTTVRMRRVRLRAAAASAATGSERQGAAKLRHSIQKTFERGHKRLRREEMDHRVEDEEQLVSWTQRWWLDAFIVCWATSLPIRVAQLLQRSRCLLSRMVGSNSKERDVLGDLNRHHLMVRACLNLTVRGVLALFF